MTWYWERPVDAPQSLVLLPRTRAAAGPQEPHRPAFRQAVYELGLQLPVLRLRAGCFASHPGSRAPQGRTSQRYAGQSMS